MSVSLSVPSRYPCASGGELADKGTAHNGESACEVHMLQDEI
jgi:hypothetical protein